MLDTVAAPRRDYGAALASDAAARRLRGAAVVWLVLTTTLAVLAAILLVGGIITADTTNARWVCALCLVGDCVFAAGCVLVGLAGVAFGRDIQARAPWLRP